MGEKSVQKRNYILETARKVFVEKGYKNVTMKDIVDACEISRGGLYLYFDSTEQILLEVLQMEADETDDIFTRNITEEDTAADILTLFLKEQKKELLRKKNSLTVAVYEYFFAHKSTDKNNMLRKQFDAGVRVLEKLIEAGIESGEFYCEDPKGAASNIMYVLEGMKIDAQTFGITEKMVDEQLLYIMQGLIIE
jgi:AcrR family transcriptional regulator